MKRKSPIQEKKRFDAEVGQRIREARQRLGMTQEQFAEAVMNTRLAILNIEAGKQAASPFMLAVVADFVGVSINELVPTLSFLSAQAKVTVTVDGEEVPLTPQLRRLLLETKKAQSQ